MKRLLILAIAAVLSGVTSGNVTARPAIVESDLALRKLCPECQPEKPATADREDPIPADPEMPDPVPSDPTPSDATPSNPSDPVPADPVPADPVPSDPTPPVNPTPPLNPFPSPPVDGGQPPVDGGQPPVDSGTPPPVDSGTPPPVDGGQPPVDGGTPPPVDGGQPPVDGGTPPPVDGGQPPVDGGNPGMDPMGKDIDLAIDKLEVKSVGVKFELQGTIKNLSTEEFKTGKRFFLMEQFKAGKWTKLEVGKVPALAANAEVVKIAKLAAAPAADAKFRMRLIGKDSDPSNDSKEFTPTAGGTGTDLGVIDVAVTKVGPLHILKGTVKNNGPKASAGGRAFKLERFNGTTWVSVKNGFVPALAVTASTTQQAPLAGAVSAGTKFRMVLTGTDSVPANDAKELTFGGGAGATDLAVLSVSVTKIGPAFVLKGTVKNLGPAAAAAGRPYKLERFNGTTWVALKSGTLSALALNATETEQALLVGSPSPGSKFRMILLGTDIVAANNVKEFTLGGGTATTDLAVINVSVTKIGPSFVLKGTVKNLGPAPAVAGRAYKLERFNGTTWISLKSGTLSALAVNALETEQVLIPFAPPPASKFRMILLGSDAVAANNSKETTLGGGGTPTTADLAVVGLSVNRIGATWIVQGLIRDLGPTKYNGGRSYRLERKVGGGWVTVKSGLIAPLSVGGSMPVNLPLGAVKPLGAEFRLTITPGDANAANNSRTHKVF